MSLYISFVEPETTAAYITSVFEDTFGVDIMVDFSPIKKNTYNIKYKTAIIRYTNSSRDFERFKEQIRQHGSNIFLHRGTNSWTIRMNETITVNYTKAYIM
jgi:hypothetical protein